MMMLPLMFKEKSAGGTTLYDRLSQSTLYAS